MRWETPDEIQPKATACFTRSGNLSGWNDPHAESDVRLIAATNAIWKR